MDNIIPPTHNISKRSEHPITFASPIQKYSEFSHQFYILLYWDLYRIKGKLKTKVAQLFAIFPM